MLELISFGLHHEVGSTEYCVVLAVSLAAWLVVARVFMGLYQSDRGVVGALLALVFPVVLGLLAYGFVDSQLVPQMKMEWARQYLPLGALAVVAVLIVLLISKRCIQLDGVVTLIIFICASLVAVGAFCGAMITLEAFEKSGEQFKDREERNKQQIESVM